MKKTNKIISIMLVLILLTGCGTKEKNNQNNDNNNDNDQISQTESVKINTNENVIKDQMIDGLSMTNTSLVIDNGISYFVTEVVNETGADYTLNEYTIIIKDKAGNEIVRIPGYVGSIIKNGEHKTLNSSINMDLINAESVEYEVIRN